MKGIGRQMSVGIAKEAVRGTAEANADFWVPFAEATVDDRDERAVDNQSYGVIEESQDETVVKQYSEVSIGGALGDSHFGLLLLNLLGSVNSAATADLSGNVYAHTYSVQQSAQHQSLSVFLDDPLAGADYVHALAAMDSLSITAALNDYIRYSATMRAQKGSVVGGGLTPATTSENKFTNRHLTFKLAANKAGLDAAVAIKLKSLELSVTKNLIDDDVLGQLAPEDFLNQSFTISGSIEATWQNETDFQNDAIAGNAKAMRIDILSNASIGDTSNPQLRIDLAKVKLKPVTRPLTLDGIVMQTVEFQAFYSRSDSEMVEMVLTNLETGY